MVAQCSSSQCTGVQTASWFLSSRRYPIAIPPRYGGVAGLTQMNDILSFAGLDLLTSLVGLGYTNDQVGVTVVGVELS